MQGLCSTLWTQMAKPQSTTQSSKAATRWLNFCWNKESTSSTRTSEEQHLLCSPKSTTRTKLSIWWCSMVLWSVMVRKKQQLSKQFNQSQKKNKKLMNEKSQRGTYSLPWEKAATMSLWLTKSLSSSRLRTPTLRNTSLWTIMASPSHKSAVCRFQK